MADAKQDRNPVQLELWNEPPAPPAPASASVSAGQPVEQPVPAGRFDPRRTRTPAQCRSCGHRAASLAEDARMRADMRVLWLHPDPGAAGGVREGFHCQHCQPRQVADTECALCDDGGPLLAGQFATDSVAGRVPGAVAAWLTTQGWHTGNGCLTCPNHHPG
jgi:hypothetical protein